MRKYKLRKNPLLNTISDRNSACTESAIKLFQEIYNYIYNQSYNANAIYTLLFGLNRLYVKRYNCVFLDKPFIHHPLGVIFQDDNCNKLVFHYDMYDYKQYDRINGLTEEQIRQIYTYCKWCIHYNSYYFRYTYYIDKAIHLTNMQGICQYVKLYHTIPFELLKKY